MSALASYAVVTSDKHGTILSVNQNALQLFGYSSGELIGQKVNLLMPSPYSEQHDSYISRYHQSKEPHMIGAPRIVNAINKNGELMLLNITLSESETVRGMMYIALFEKARDRRVIFDVDSKGKIYSVKGNLFLTFGYHKEELIGANIAKLCPPLIAEQHMGYMTKYAETGESSGNIIGHIRNVQAIHKNRREPINVSLHVNKANLRIRKLNGKVDQISGFRGIMTPVDDIESMVALSKSGVILSASPEFFLLFGYSENEVVGENISVLVKGDLREVFGKSLQSTQPVRRNIVGLHKDGSIFTAEIEIQKLVGGKETETSDKSYICKIVRVSSKKQDKDLIPEGEYMGMYKYGKILGSGYFGKVRMAYHRITNEKVAIKTLRKKQYLNVNMEYPPREIAVLKSIDHPNINRLYDTVVLDDRIHLILEYVEGRELCEIVETESIPEDICRHLWRQILNAVDYLHTNGIVHRDLKLENIIIDRFGNAKVIDLGFGNFVLNENHVLRTFCGSPDYAAPELFLGKAYKGTHADIWSLGVLLFALLSGLLPFKDSQCVMKGVFKFPPSITAKARDLITKILQTDPEKRISMKEILKHPWTNVGYANLPKQPISLFNCEVDDSILSSMETYGMDPNTVRNCLQKKEFNQFTTTYFLLQKKVYSQSIMPGEDDHHSNINSNGRDQTVSGGVEGADGKLEPRKRRLRRRASTTGEECTLL